MPELDKKSPVCPDCLACGFPFWEQLTPAEQERLCRSDVGEYTAFAVRACCRCGGQRETVALISDVFLDEGTAERCVRQWNRMELDVIHLWDVIDDLLAL